jgi:hypothetical protein
MHTITITVTDHRIGIVKGDKLRAVPVYAEYPNQKLLIGHRLVEGENAGVLLFTSYYIVTPTDEPPIDKTKLIDETKLVAKTVNLIKSWEAASYTKSPEEDRKDFAADLVQFFKAHLI